VSAQAQQAREALGARLREIRLDAGLNARALASVADWHFTKVSKLEHGTRPPSAADIRTWCRCCAAEDQVTDLIATARSIDAMYSEWQRQMRAGLKHFHQSWVPQHDNQTHAYRIYETTVMPGLLNTASYAAAIIGFWAELMDLPTDIDMAVATRLERQKILYRRDRRFEFVLEEQALRTRVGDAETMTEQLDRLLALMSLPGVRLGIIPAAGERKSLAQGSFWIYDETRVQIETVTAGIDITQPAEIALYAEVFSRLRQSAVYAREARALIAHALAEITTN
jgi:transcriptional regulator with XRE-family HTH domain